MEKVGGRLVWFPHFRVTLHPPTALIAVSVARLTSLFNTSIGLGMRPCRNIKTLNVIPSDPSRREWDWTRRRIGVDV